MHFDFNQFRTILAELYGDDPMVLDQQRQRYQSLTNQFRRYFPEVAPLYFSSPGRTEIGGNHTDHNHGRVLAASVNLDSIAAAAKNGLNRIVLHSEGYPAAFSVDLSDLNVREGECGTTAALIRGIAARFRQLGFKVGGFSAFVSSEVMPGSGLSSSASIEVLIATILNYLFNNGAVPKEQIALISQYAENEYFGKPCGLMDQIICAIGGVVSIDFKEPQHPVIKNINFDFNNTDYRLLVVNTGGNHADLTPDYAAITAEMKAVARELGAEVCRDINMDRFFQEIRSLRSLTGDRSILRALHFLTENERVLHQVGALEQGDFKKFLSLVNESGNSSFKWLQNVYSTQNANQQGLGLALALTELFLNQTGAGACRVHGGGFAGTIQVFLPEKEVQRYASFIETIFGAGVAINLRIRKLGAVCLNQFISSSAEI
ncbi:MAG TPA: galactokinase [bacterium]|nr:galactokinase [bacterium]